jgi:trimeric autotransporter adhesin
MATYLALPSITPREANSFTDAAFTYATPGSFFIGTTGATNLLVPVAGITTQAESGGVTISTPAITTDYLGTARTATPDLGAYEFAGITPAPQIATVVASPAANECVNVARGIGATITTASGTITSAQIDYTVNGVAQVAIPMTLILANIYTGTIPTVTPANATVVWSISATNSIPLTATSASGTYKDEPLTGFTGSASASISSVCAGSPTALTAIINNPAASVLYTTPVITFPAPDEDLRTVKITQGPTTLLDNSSTVGSLVGTIGTAAGTVGSYSNFTAFAPTVLTAGQSYTLFVASRDAVAAFYANYATAFIDYNRDGDFADAGELLTPTTGLLFSAATDNGNDSISVNFTIPAAVSNGLTRMRVSITEDGQTNAAGTINNSYGEFEDYSINLSGGTILGTTTGITSVTWLDGATTLGTGNPLTVNPIANTTYSANITAFGCVLAPSPTVTVTTVALPTAPTATNSAQCGTAIATAVVTSTTGLATPTFNWYAATTGGVALQSSTSTTYTTAVTATTTFHVSELNSITGCESPRTPITVTVASADLISATTSLAVICQGASVTLTAANLNATPLQSYTYTWTSVAGSGVTSTVGASILATPILAGTYTYTANAIDGSCTALATVVVTVNPLTAVITPVAITCNGYNNGSFTLGATTCATGALTYSVDAGAFGAIPTNLTPGAHTVIVKDANNIESASISITIIEPVQTIPAPTATPASACVGATVANVSAISAGAPIAQTPIVVNFGLTAQPTEVNAAPGTNISSATLASLPAGAVITGLTLSSTGLIPNGGEYQSDSKLGFSGIFTNAAASGTGTTGFGTVAGVPYNYTRAVPVAGFPTTGGTLNLMFWDEFNDVVGGADVTFPLSSSSVTLTINYTIPSSLPITWWDAATAGTQQGTGSPLNAIGTLVLPNSNTPGVTTLYAQANNATCTNLTRTAVTVTINALPTIAGGVDQTVCAGTAVTLTATSVDAITWAGPVAVTNAVAFTPPVGVHTFIATATNAAGCTKNDTVIVTVNALPIVNAGTDTVLCAGLPYTFAASGAVSYSWAGPVAVTNGTPVVLPLGVHTFTVTGTNAAGCAATDAIQVTINALPTVLAGNDTTVCAGIPVTFSGSGASTYTWAGPIPISNGVAFSNAPAGVHTFIVTGTNALGCVDTDTVVLTVNPSPIVSAGVDQAICVGSSVTLTGTGASTYSWTGPVPVTNAAAFTPPAGIHTFIVTGSALGCTDTDTVVVTVNQTTVLAGIDQTVCAGTSTTFNATGATTYAWAGPIPVTNGVAFTAPAGIHTFIVTGTTAGCTDTDTLVLTVNTLPTIAGGANQTVCSGVATTLTATGAPTITWAGPIPVTNAVAFTAPVGVHTFIATGINAAGCSSTDTVVITVNALPTMLAGPDQSACAGSPVTLTATGAPTITWAGPIAITNGVAFVAPVGVHTFTATGTNAAGCTATDAVTVTINAAPVAVATVSGIVVTSTTAGVTYQWINCPANTVVAGATSASYTATVNGNYAVVTTNPSGCKDTSGCVSVTTVSLEDVKGITNVSIAPNPTTGEFTISMSNVEENTTITVFDAAGKVINVYTNVSSTTTVDITDVQTGIYMVEVRNANGSKMYRVAKN